MDLLFTFGNPRVAGKKAKRKKAKRAKKSGIAKQNKSGTLRKEENTMAKKRRKKKSGKKSARKRTAKRSKKRAKHKKGTHPKKSLTPANPAAIAVTAIPNPEYYTMYTKGKGSYAVDQTPAVLSKSEISKLDKDLSKLKALEKHRAKRSGNSASNSKFVALIKRKQANLERVKKQSANVSKKVALLVKAAKKAGLKITKNYASLDDVPALAREAERIKHAARAKIAAANSTKKGKAKNKKIRVYSDVEKAAMIGASSLARELKSLLQGVVKGKKGFNVKLSANPKRKKGKKKKAKKAKHAKSRSKKTKKHAAPKRKHAKRKSAKKKARKGIHSRKKHKPKTRKGHGRRARDTYNAKAMKRVNKVGKKKSKHGKKKSYRVKRNPSGGAMGKRTGKVHDTLRQYSGHDGMEIGGLAAGGALIGILPVLLNNFLPASIAPTLAQFHFADVILPLALGVGLNMSDSEVAKDFGKGLAAAAIVQGAMQASIYGLNATTGLHGLGYNPVLTLKGIKTLPRGAGDFGGVRVLPKNAGDFGAIKTFSPGAGDFGGQDVMDGGVDDMVQTG